MSVEFLEANGTSRICWTGKDSLTFPPDKCLMNAICNFQKIYKDYAYDDDGDDEESVIDDSASNDDIPNQ